MAIKGVDVARYQPTNPDTAANLHGIQFYIAKATEGTSPDPTYAAHIAHARARSIPLVMAYHFGRNDVPVAQQLAAFLVIAGDVDGYALDVEGANAIPKAQALYFRDGMHDAGKRIGLYHSLSGFPNWGFDWDWVAFYNSTPPSISWDMWQYGPAAPNIDGDLFRGTTDELAALIGANVAQAPITNETAQIITVAPGKWYDLDGTTVLKSGPALPARLSPYGVGIRRAIYVEFPDGSNKRRIALVTAATTSPVPAPDCTAEVAAAIAADRLKARITYA